MKTVKSYHFRYIPPSVDLLETPEIPIPPLSGNYVAEGDVVPPVARITGEIEVYVVHQERYVRYPNSPDFTIYSGSGNIFVFNRALNEPVAFLESARQATCGGYLGMEEIGTTSTHHVRFVFLPIQQPTSSGALAEGWDVWIEDRTGHVAQIEVLNMGYSEYLCSPRAEFPVGSVQPHASSAGTLQFERFNLPIFPPIEIPANATRSPSYATPTP